MTNNGTAAEDTDLWDHLEELRHVLFRIAVAVVFLMLVAFLFKDELFAIVLAPKNADFIIYHFFAG